MTEMVVHPKHYNLHPSGVECIELIRGLSFNIGSAVKYVFRRGDKGNELEDLRKAKFYIEDYLAHTSYFGARLNLGNLGDKDNWWRVIDVEPDGLARAFYYAVLNEDVHTALGRLSMMIDRTRNDNGPADD